MRPIATILAVLALATTQAVGQSEFRPITIRSDYNHLRFAVEPTDHVVTFGASVASFDLDDDDNGDGVPDLWGVPEWIACQLNPVPPLAGGTATRPNDWIAAPNMPAGVRSPTDDSYRNSDFSRGTSAGARTPAAWATTRTSTRSAW